VTVSFIIPLYNCLPLTQAMLTSLQATRPSGLAHEIIFVDDGSTDGTRAWLETLEGREPFRVLLNERNLGYAAANNRAFSMLQRDVRNMAEYFGQFAPELLDTRYAEEMWALFEEGKLTPDSPLTGKVEETQDSADVQAVLREIKAALADEARRQAALQADDQEALEPTPPWAR